MTDFASTRVTTDGLGATLGTATTVKTSGVASFTVGGVAVAAQVARDLTVAVGDVCVIQRVGSQWFAVQRFYTAAPADPGNPALPVPKPVSVSGTLVIPAVETRSYRNSAWLTTSDDVFQGEFAGAGVYTGCAFYGPGALGLAGATISSATVMLRRAGSGGLPAAQALTLRLVTESAVPSGAPTLTSTTAGPSLAWGESATFSVPTAWIDSLAAGTSGGIAVYESDGSPYVVLDGRGRYTNSFTLTINWSR